MNKFLKFMSYVIVATASSLITVHAVIGITGNEYSKLAEMTALIDQRYVDEYDKTAMEDAAANAMIGALGDRWSYYISAEDYQNYQEQMANAYVGVGITIQQRQDLTGMQVLEVVKGSPAEEAGVQAGDTLIAVNGQNKIGRAHV